MITIKTEIKSIYEFGEFLMQHTWLGAKDRVVDMELEEIQKLYDYLNEMEVTMTEVQLNDFVWFEWDEIKNEDKPF